MAKSAEAKWKKALGWPLSDEARERLGVQWEGKSLKPADVRYWEGAPSLPAGTVALEVLFPGLNPKDFEETRFGEAVRAAVQETIRDQQCSEFRSKLAQRQDAALRRRKTGTAEVEGGDATEESWRDYLQTPASELTVRAHGVADIGTRNRSVLACRLLFDDAGADQLGRIVFSSIFEPEEEKTPVRWQEDPFLVCFYSCAAIIFVVVVIWIILIYRAVTRPRTPRVIPTLPPGL